VNGVLGLFLIVRSAGAGGSRLGKEVKTEGNGFLLGDGVFRGPGKSNWAHRQEIDASPQIIFQPQGGKKGRLVFLLVQRPMIVLADTGADDRHRAKEGKRKKDTRPQSHRTFLEERLDKPFGKTKSDVNEGYGKNILFHASQGHLKRGLGGNEFNHVRGTSPLTIKPEPRAEDETTRVRTKGGRNTPMGSPGKLRSVCGTHVPRGV